MIDAPATHWRKHSQAALTHSENVFLNFQTLGAATAKQYPCVGLRSKKSWW
jgi:hypothetical protein